MGIIDSLSAGYRFVVRRLELLVLPLLLDAVLWLSPRLSIEPILNRLAALYRDTGLGVEEGGPDVSQLMDQMAQILTLLAESSNLLVLLVSRTLYRMPSLLVSVPELKSGHESIQIEAISAAGLLTLLLGLAGLLIGVVYMNLLARALPLGEGDKRLALPQFAAQIAKQWLRTIAFLIGVFFLLLMIYVPGSIGIALLVLISPALASGALLLLSGFVFVVLFYLYFVTVGLVLDDLPLHQAVVRSVLLVRHNFWPTLGFILVSGIIAQGINLLLLPLVEAGSVGTLLAAPANAFIGTGLAMALLVFYRTRLLVLAEGTHQMGEQAKVRSAKE